MVLNVDAQRRRRGHHLFVTDRRDASAIKNEVVESLKEFVSQRFSVDKNEMDILRPFMRLQKEADVKKVYKLKGIALENIRCV